MFFSDVFLMYHYALEVQHLFKLPILQMMGLEGEEQIEQLEYRDVG